MLTISYSVYFVRLFSSTVKTFLVRYNYYYYYRKTFTIVERLLQRGRSSSQTLEGTTLIGIFLQH